MKTKLTLRVDEDTIKKAKLYSKKRGESVSSLVEKFFSGFDDNGIKKETLPPTTEELKGLLKDKNCTKRIIPAIEHPV